VKGNRINQNTRFQLGASIEKLQSFIAGLDHTIFASVAAENCAGNYDKQTLADYLETYLNETIVGLKLIEPYLVKHQRILEVGSGIGVLTRFLKEQGFDVVGIEPGAEDAFGFMSIMSSAVAAALPAGAQANSFAISAETLNLSDHGQFDLIFSVNVLEHVMQLNEAMKAMSCVFLRQGS
jgi:2-polyprenyl-3-methyl-5-hydroxy-6-metoxy-1,4-benzoquinol methylase